MVKIPSLEEMLKVGLHFGHRTSKWHPKMKPYIFTERKGIHIINLVKSQEMLEEALNYIKKLTSEGKVVLFVSTKAQAQIPMKDMAEESGSPYIVEKWIGGCLTNFGVIKKSIKKYNDLVDQKTAGTLDKYTKKERIKIDHEIERLRKRVGGLSSLRKLPDAIFIWDIKKENTALAEAKKKKLSIIAVCDTNTNPTDIQYVIPINDDATKGVKMILNVIKDAINEGRDVKAKEVVKE